MSRLQNLKNGRNYKQLRAGQLIRALEVLGGAEAMKLRDELLGQLKIIEDVTTGATGASGDAATAKRTSAAADKDFRSGVDGAVSLVLVGHPELKEKIPSRDTYAGVDDDAYADVVAKAFTDAGLEELARAVRKAKTRRLNLAREAQKASQTVAGGKVHTAGTELAQLVLLNSQAEVYIRRNAEPGSEVLEMIKHPARGGTKHKSKDKGGKGAGETKSEPGSTATPQPAPLHLAPAPAANEVAPAPAPATVGAHV